MSSEPIQDQVSILIPLYNGEAFLTSVIPILAARLSDNKLKVTYIEIEDEENEKKGEWVTEIKDEENEKKGDSKSDLAKTRLRVVMIDDDSRDDTWELANGFKDSLPESEKQCWELESLSENTRKVGAVKYGLEKIKTPYVLILDSDSIPQKGDSWAKGTTVCEVIESLANEMSVRDIQAYGFRISPYKEDSYVEKMQGMEYAIFSEGARRVLDLPICLSGTGTLWQTKVIKEILSVHSGVFEGDDLESTLRAHDRKNTSLSFTNKLVMQPRVNNSWRDLFIQRARVWDPGLIAALVHYPRILLSGGTPGAFYRSVLLIDIVAHPFKIATLLFATAWSIIILTWAVYVEILGRQGSLDYPPFPRVAFRIDHWFAVSFILYLLILICALISILAMSKPWKDIRWKVRYSLILITYSLSPLLHLPVVLTTLFPEQFIFAFQTPGSFVDDSLLLFRLDLTSIIFGYLLWTLACAFLLLISSKANRKYFVLVPFAPIYFGFLLIPRTIGFIYALKFLVSTKEQKVELK